MTANNIRIALTNLGKYNEGELAYTWLELPATDEEISEAMRKIGIGSKRDEWGGVYEEYFISDYEAPFSIDEYESLANLNELAEAIEGVEFPEKAHVLGYDVKDVINFAHELESAGLVEDAYEYIGDIVSDADLDELVKQEAENRGWHGVRYFLMNADPNEEYHLIDGYGNIARLGSGTLESIVSDLLDEMKSNL